MMKWRLVSRILLIAAAFLLISCTTGSSMTEGPDQIATNPQEPSQAPVEPTESQNDIMDITWQTTAEQWKGMFGHRQTVSLPPGGEEAPFQGSGAFDYDSSIGSAAVHMGLLTYAAGGIVTIEIREGPEYTKGGESYDGWNTIFVFLDEHGNMIVPDESDVLHIPIPEEAVQGPFAPPPDWFSITNRTGMTLAFLDIFTNDMQAVDAFGYNLLPKEVLEDSDTAMIMFEDHPDLEESILYRYGQLFHVFAEDSAGNAYYREWYPDFDSLDVVLDPSHRMPTSEITPAPPGTIRIVNHTDYEIIDLYILTAQMEDALDFSIELLDGSSLPAGSSIDFLKEDLAYLDRHLSKEVDEQLVILAFDEDDYMLEKPWSPAHEEWTIVLTHHDYYTW